MGVDRSSKFGIDVAGFALLLAAWVLPNIAVASPVIPNYWDDKERLPRPDLSSYERVLFLTTIDFPPFNFIDGAGRLSGFHIDLARAICSELAIAERCQIQALPWEELDEAIAAGNGEALIAGTAITAQARETYAFSRPYLKFPARFVVRRNGPVLEEPLHASLGDTRVGVIEGSAHEKMLRARFPEVEAVPFQRQEALYDELREGSIGAIFGDGMRMAFWLGGTASQDCCRFAGGPYIAPEFLGDGLAIAVPREDAVLAEAFDFALREIAVKGTFAELYLKYFPVSFY
jgi:polar amino acid transport system substrate-binding protein